MMPFIDIGPFELGPLKLHLFGILVAAGVVIGSWLSARYAEKNEIDVDWLRWAAFRSIIGGFFIAHMIDVIAYQPGALAKDPALLFKVWAGFSSYGGFIGGLVMLLWHTQKRFQPPVTRLELGDCALYGFAPGFWFGRWGCTSAHDHAGRVTDFFLGVHYPRGRHPNFPGGISPEGVYHDLGLYEAIGLMPLVVLGLVLLVRWKGRKPGHLTAFVTMAYAAPRFFLDYLRYPGSDPRYLGLTPGQYFSIAMFLAGAYLLFVVIPKQPKTTAMLAQERRDARTSKSVGKDIPAAKAKPKTSAKKSPTKPASKKGKKKKR